LGVPRKPFYTNIHVDSLAVIEAGLRRLESYGIKLIEVDIPEIDILDQRSGFIIADYEMIPDLEAYLQDHHSKLCASDIISEISSPDVKRILSGIVGQGGDSQIYYREAMDETRRDMQYRYRQYFDNHLLDGIVFPTTPLPATPIGEDDVVILTGETEPLFQSFIRNTSPGSVAGIPGITLPCGLTPNRLPVGMEIDGPCGSDRRLLAIAMAIEKNEPVLPNQMFN
jgi:mandelamide amidase